MCYLERYDGGSIDQLVKVARLLASCLYWALCHCVLGKDTNVNFLTGTLVWCKKPAQVQVSKWHISEKKMKNQIKRNLA